MQCTHGNLTKVKHRIPNSGFVHVNSCSIPTLFHTISFFVRKSAVVTSSLLGLGTDYIWIHEIVMLLLRAFKACPKPWIHSRVRFIMRDKTHRKLIASTTSILGSALRLPRSAVTISLVTGATIALARPYVQQQAPCKDLWSPMSDILAHRHRRSWYIV